MRRCRQEIIYFGILEDTEEDIPGFLMKYFKAVPRFNPRILDAAGESAPEQLALTGKLAANAEPFASLGHLHHPGTEDGLKGVTHWVAVDVETQVHILFSLTLPGRHARRSKAQRDLSRRPARRCSEKRCCISRMLSRRRAGWPSCSTHSRAGPPPSSAEPSPLPHSSLPGDQRFPTSSLTLSHAVSRRLDPAFPSPGD